MNQSARSAFPWFMPFGFMVVLWKQRALLWQFTLRNIELRHKGSHLGLIWSLLNPLLMLGLYVFVFGYIFKGSFRVLQHETKGDYALALFLGLTIFQLFAEVLAISPTVIVGSPSLVKRVIFPIDILPAAMVGSSIFHMLISLGLVLVGVATLGPGLTLRCIWLPCILFPMVPLALGIGWFFSAIGVFFRDINQVIAFFTQAIMWASALFYPASIIPHAAWIILRFNPILLTVELARATVMWNLPINFSHLIFLWVLGFVVSAAGFSFFRRKSSSFADEL